MKSDSKSIGKTGKIYILQYAEPDLGLFTLVTVVLNFIKIALEQKTLPIVNFDKNVSYYFYDPNSGENIWSYYFEPIFEPGFEDLGNYLKNKHIKVQSLKKIDSKEKFDRFFEKKKSESAPWYTQPLPIKHYWVGETPEDPTKWMQEKRALGRQYVQKYIRVKKHIWSIIDDFYEKYFEGYFMLGVHIRGTDFGYADPISTKKYFAAIRSIMQKHTNKNIRIFLATDQKQFVESFQKEFGDLLLTYDAIRSSDERAPFHLTNVSPYKKGEDVLVDALLLSKCDFLFKCASAVGEYALWFNPELECVDFALETKWDSSHYAPASLRLNVNNLHPVLWRSLLLYKKSKRKILDAVILIGRKTLPPKFRDWLWVKVGRFLYFFK